DDPALAELARRASMHLSAAGRGALDRGDFNAGRALVGRATGLLAEGDEARLALAPDYAEMLFESGDERAWEVLTRATRAVDPKTRARVTVTMATWSITGSQEEPFDQREAWRDEARAVFESTGDDYGLALYWESVSWEAWMAMRAAQTVDACEHALVHLARADAQAGRLLTSVRRRLRGSYYQGPTAVAEAIERIAELDAADLGVLEQAGQRSAMGLLLALTGDVDRGRELHRDAQQGYRDAGLLQSAGGMALRQAEIEFRAGDPGEEERVL